MSVQVLAVLGGLALIGLVALVRHLRRTATRARHGMYAVSRTGGAVLRTLATAVAIVAVQWAVIALVARPLATGAVLGVPAVFAGASIARLLTTTDVAATTAAWRP